MPHNEVLSPAALNTWLTEKTLAGVTEAEMVGGFCKRLAQQGIPLARAIVLVDTLHPIYEGRAFRWNRETAQAEVFEYGRTQRGSKCRGLAPESPLLHDGCF